MSSSLVLTTIYFSHYMAILNMLCTTGYYWSQSADVNLCMLFHSATNNDDEQINILGDMNNKVPSLMFVYYKSSS
jgi:hypothetical protein